MGMLANVRVSKHGLRVWAPYFCAKRYISLVCVCVYVCSRSCLVSLFLIGCPWLECDFWVQKAFRIS